MIDVKGFRKLESSIVACRKCPRLVEWRERTAKEKVRRYMSDEYWGRPLPAFGEPQASLIIVGLAPAAHGGNRTGRMFTGDRSGNWLFEALHRFGFASRPVSVDRNDQLTLTDCLITAALRCAPPANKPLPEEIHNCRPYLCRELQLAANKKVIVALGLIAFKAFLKAWQLNDGLLPHGEMKFKHGAEWVLLGGITLIASYHPSQQNTQTGRLTRAMFHRIFDRARSILYGSFLS